MQRTQIITRWAGAGILVVVAVLGARILWQDAAQQWARWQGSTDTACGMNYCDHALFWLAGRLSRAGDFDTLYQPQRFMAYAAQMMPGQLQYLPFVYPPPMLMPAALISFGSVRDSYCIMSASLAVASVWLLRRAGLRWWVILAGLLSPAGLWAVYLGQFGLAGAAILLAGLSGARHRPWRSGALLALLCLKPQYGLLVPVVLLAGRNWAAIASCAASVIAILGMSRLCFGMPAWSAYLGAGRGAMQGLLQAPFGPGYEMHGVSVFWMLRSFGAGLELAYAGQICCALSAGGAAWWLWQQYAERSVAPILCLTLLVSPYGFTDDMVGYSLALAMLMRRDAVRENAALAILWLAPGYTGHFAAMAGVLVTPLLVLAAAAIGWASVASPATADRRGGLVRSAPPAPAHSPQ